MRSIGVVSVGRTDWSIWRPVLEEIRKYSDLDLRLYITGSHLSPEFGMTVTQVEEGGFKIDERVEVLLSSDSPQGVAKAIGVGVMGFAQVFDRAPPDILLVMGDRFETLAAVTAALPFNIPVAHVHGGESTEGAIDDAIRHAITKMSHIHFAATEQYARRIHCMGEEEWRVHTTGAPGIDAIKRTKPFSHQKFADQYGIDSEQPFLLVCYHPVTLEYEDTLPQVRNLLSALEQVDLQVCFTYPNSDTAGRTILAKLQEYVGGHKGSRLLVNMGPIGYTSAMSHAAAMVGNSSSGIIEAASYLLPVVNVGTRQRGRLRPRNVVDVGYKPEDIAQGIRKALSPEFRAGLQGLENPYGDGKASERIVSALKEIELGRRLIMKTFTWS